MLISVLVDLLWLLTYSPMRPIEWDTLKSIARKDQVPSTCMLNPHNVTCTNMHMSHVHAQHVHVQTSATACSPDACPRAHSSRSCCPSSTCSTSSLWSGRRFHWRTASPGA